MNRFLAALALACAIALGACTTRGDSSAGWGQIASGVGIVLGETRLDAQVEKASARLAQHCAELQTASLAVGLFAPDKLRSAAAEARAVVATFCAGPPKSVAAALAAVSEAFAAIEAARRAG